MRDYFLELSDCALKTPLSEICGFLHLFENSLRFQQVKNIARDPSTMWQIDDTDYVEAIATKTLYGLAHSHILVDEKFSSDDIKTSEMSELPMLVYSVKTNRFNYYRPMAALRPYVRRAFIMGVQDCATLFYDYFEKEYGLRLPFKVKDPQAITNGYGDAREIYKEHFAVAEGKLQKDDVLIFTIRNDGFQNHVGIYQGEGIFLHQLKGRASAMDLYSSSWKRHTAFALRLRKNFTSKENEN